MAIDDHLLTDGTRLVAGSATIDACWIANNEAMAGAFIDADRARDRHELNKLSDVELLRFEVDYQEALRLRMHS